MQKIEFTIKEATPTDTATLANLMTVLGYETTPEEMKTRYDNIIIHPDYKTFVATTSTEIVGMIGLSKNLYYEKNGVYVRVLAMVTSKEFRQQGVGQALLDKAESWAREVGAESIFLNSGNREERAQAHQFYKNRGFTVKSSGFVKKL